MAIQYVHAVLQGGPQAGPIKIPTLDGVPPPTANGGTGSEMVEYQLTTDTDEFGRPIYRPSTMLHFVFEDPDGPK